MDQLAKAANKLDIAMGALMLEVDDVVRGLRRQGVDVVDSRDQTSAAKRGKAAAATVAFLGGALLGGIIAGVIADRESEES